MYHSIIVDHDNFYLDTLAGMLDSYPDFKVIRKIKDVTQVIKYIITLKPDVVFLNINMPGKDGLEVLNEINELEVPTRVIFTSESNEYPFDALTRKTCDCLIHPLDKKELDKALVRFKDEPLHHNLATVIPDKTKIALRNTNGAIMLDAGTILYIQAGDYYTNIYDIYNRAVVKSKNPGKIEDEFPNSFFFKISQSVIVNMNFILSIDRNKRLVTLNTSDGGQVSLKANRKRLYDLEIMVRNLT